MESLPTLPSLPGSPTILMLMKPAAIRWLNKVWALHKASLVEPSNSMDSMVRYLSLMRLSSSSLTSLSIEAWIYPTGPGYFPNSNAASDYQSRRRVSNVRQATVRFGTPSQYQPCWDWVFTGYIAPENSWTHLALTYDGADAEPVCQWCLGSLARRFRSNRRLSSYFE